jgi:hypothetical protein
MNPLQKLVKVFRWALAETFWKDAVKAGVIPSENQSSVPFKDGFLLGAFAVDDTANRKGLKRLRQKVLSSGADLKTLFYLIDRSVEDLWAQCSQFQMGGSNRKEPLYKEGVSRQMPQAMKSWLPKPIRLLSSPDRDR